MEKTLVLMGQEFGYTDVNKRVLIPAIKEAMQGLAEQAKQMAPKDSHLQLLLSGEEVGNQLLVELFL